MTYISPRTNKVKYQVTLTNPDGHYKPVSAMVYVNQENKETDLLKNPTDKKNIIEQGIQNICFVRSWGKKDLSRYGYTKVKARKYDKEKIEQENKERYEKIKEQHYADGTWKRPKNN